MSTVRLNGARPIALRMVADGVLMTASLATAVVVSLMATLPAAPPTPDQRLNAALASFVIVAPLLAVVAVVVFYVRGLYTHRRTSGLRAKMTRLIESDTLAFAVVGALQLPLSAHGGIGVGTIALAWAVSLVLLAASRYWSTTWQTWAVADSGSRRERRAADGVGHVLVIGGAGYIGSALLPRLLDAGFKVRLLDLLLFGEEPIRKVLGHPNLELMQADYRQVDRLVTAMAGVDAVVHLGGIVGDPACSLDEELTTEVNLAYTRVIAEVAKGSGIKRFVFASSCSVYGASDEVLDETSRLNPVSLYARSKIASENVLFEMADGGFAPTMLRFGTIFGLSGRTRFDLVVNLLTAKALETGQITVYGGDQWRPFVHVDDAARAIQAVVEAPLDKVRNEIFNVGSNAQNATLGDVGRIVERLVPGSRYVDSGPDGDRRNYRVDFSKVTSVLGFQPTWTLEAGVRQVIDAVRSGRVQDYRDPMYSNVRFLQDGRATRYTRVRKDWANTRIAGDVSLSLSPKKPLVARPPDDAPSLGEIMRASAWKKA